MERGDINKEEIREAIRGLRDGKAAGCDGISGEYANMEGRKWWSGGGTFVIGCGRVRGDFDGDVIQDIYDGVSGKIKEGVRGKKGDSAESGFRKGMGTIDNIYVLNYLINRQLGRGRRMVALFVDLKTAFDTIDRKILCETMRERGIKKGFSIE